CWLLAPLGAHDDRTVVQSIFGGAFSVKSRAAKGTPIISLRPGSVDVEQSQGAAAEQSIELPAADPAKSAKITSIDPAVGGDRPEITEASVVDSGCRGVVSARSEEHTSE